MAGSAQAQPVNDMQDAWQGYLATVDQVEQLWQNAPEYQNDPVGAYDLLAGFMTTNFTSHINSSGTSFRGRPRMGAFDDPGTRIGIDNPDTHYLAGSIPNGNGDQIYRIFGERSNSVDMIIQWFDSQSSTGGGATLEDHEIVYDCDCNGRKVGHSKSHDSNGGGNGHVCDSDGSFATESDDKCGLTYEIFLSTEALRDPAWVNWLEIPASDGLTIQRRHSMCDWTSEVPGAVHVERVGTAGVPIEDDVYANPEVMTRQIQAGTAVLANQGPFWGAFAQAIKAQLPPNFIFGWQPTGTIGITTQLSFTAWANIPDDKALIITLSAPEADYFGFQLFNFWGSSLPWADAQVSLNWGLDGSCQSQQTDDGLYHIVVSPQDPGVQNWVSTMGRNQVGMAGRLQSVNPADFASIVGPASAFRPQTQLVPVDDVLDYLPADTRVLDAEERAEQLEVRQNFVREKYIYW
jgi:hypothetical protein